MEKNFITGGEQIFFKESEKVLQSVDREGDTHFDCIAIFVWFINHQLLTMQKVT